MTEYILLGLVLFFSAFATTWPIVHSSIATECDKQGSFYVGDKVYECKRKE